MYVSYQTGLVICIILGVLGFTVGTMALLNSVKEVRLLRKMGIQNLVASGVEEKVVGSAASSVIGAIIAGLVSATLVGLYGVGPQFFYLGPIAAMVAAAGVIVCFIQDILDEKRVEKMYEHKQDKGK